MLVDKVLVVRIFGGKNLDGDVRFLAVTVGTSNGLILIPDGPEWCGKEDGVVILEVESNGCNGRLTQEHIGGDKCVRSDDLGNFVRKPSCEDIFNVVNFLVLMNGIENVFVLPGKCSDGNTILFECVIKPVDFNVEPAKHNGFGTGDVRVAHGVHFRRHSVLFVIFKIFKIFGFFGFFVLVLFFEKVQGMLRNKSALERANCRFQVICAIERQIVANLVVILNILIFGINRHDFNGFGRKFVLHLVKILNFS